MTPRYGPLFFTVLTLVGTVVAIEPVAFRGSSKEWDSPTEVPHGVENADRGMYTHIFIGLMLAVASMYAVLYAWCVHKHGHNTEERELLDKYMCCWRNLYKGKAHLGYNILCCPLVLVLHSFRIYGFTCIGIYCRRVFWLLFGRCTEYYSDSEFPPNDSSLGVVGGDFANKAGGSTECNTIWVRAMDFSRADSRQRDANPNLHSTDMCLFHGCIEAKDILQGALGDCWLLAAMATLSEHEGAISSLFLTPEIDPRGKYRLRLFDPQESKWKVIVVDDFVPCEQDRSARDGVRRGADGSIVSKYAKPNGKEIWAMLLEKAFAKFCGGYASIEAGITEWGIVCMTGGNAWRYEVAADNNLWERSDLVPIVDPKDKRACGFRPTSEHHDAGEMFELLRYYHRHGAVLCCGGVKPAGEAVGLVSKHAFSLLQVRTVRKTLGSDQYFRYVQVRNPWGTGEWTGPWSDNSSQWDEYPHVKQLLAFENSDDGSYWMQWEDFVEYWSYVGVVDCSTDIDSVRPPLHDETQPAGPLKSFFRGCGVFWCLCSGFRHLFLAHDASSKQVSKGDYHTVCGCDHSGPFCRGFERERVHVDHKSGHLARDPFELRFGNPKTNALLGGA